MNFDYWELVQRLEVLHRLARFEADDTQVARVVLFYELDLCRALRRMAAPGGWIQ